MTTTAGGCTRCLAASAATRSSVDVSTCWPGRVPSLITATGVVAARPRLISSALIASRCATAISSTRVPGPCASESQSTLAPGCDGSRCAETTAKSWVMPRCVTGIPAYAGTATALVTPGTTTNGTPARTHASASSPPRPNTNGSPPLSLTTRRPASARSTISALISSCVIVCAPGALPARTISTSGSSSSSSALGPSRSATTTSASASSRLPRTVISPGSPGPPPTSATEPSATVPVTTGPTVGRRCGRTGSEPSASASAIAERSRWDLRGSPPEVTATVTSPCLVTAGVLAADPAASSARTHQIRSRSASSATAAFTALSLVAAWTSQAPLRSPAR